MTAVQNDFMTLAQRDAIIARVNPPENFINADDKIVTAQLAARAGIPYVPIYAIVGDPPPSSPHLQVLGLEPGTQGGTCDPGLPGQARKPKQGGMTVFGGDKAQIDAAVAFILQLPSCVIKPARGTGGSGILFCGGDRQPDAHALRTHLCNIVAGLYSMGARPDRAIIQHRIQPHPFFTALHGSGVADIRVIVYLGKSVMAMLRLPTRESGGKANLHAGAVGVGVDLSTGVTTHGVYRGGAVMAHPDMGVVLAGHVLPEWGDVLHMAAQCATVSGLGFLGADIVMDGGDGLRLLEVNAQPGLSVQMANKRMLRDL